MSLPRARYCLGTRINENLALRPEFRKNDKNINTQLKYNQLNAKLKMSASLYETEKNEFGKMRVPVSESLRQELFSGLWA